MRKPLQSIAFQGVIIYRRNHNLPINNDSPSHYLPVNFDWGVIVNRYTGDAIFKNVYFARNLEKLQNWVNLRIFSLFKTLFCLHY